MTAPVAVVHHKLLQHDLKFARQVIILQGLLTLMIASTTREKWMKNRKTISSLSNREKIR